MTISRELPLLAVNEHADEVPQANDDPPPESGDFKPRPRKKLLVQGHCTRQDLALCQYLLHVRASWT